jgi:hypothetical protein
VSAPFWEGEPWMPPCQNCATRYLLLHGFLGIDFEISPSRFRTAVEHTSSSTYASLFSEAGPEYGDPTEWTPDDDSETCLLKFPLAIPLCALPCLF